MRPWFIGLSMMMMVTACDQLGVGGSGTSGGVGTSSTTDGLGGSGYLPPATSTTGVGTDGVTAGCGDDETAADPWGDEDGCDGELPTHSPWDVGNGGSCWMHLWHWNASCEEEPCLDYDCHSPVLCGPVRFGNCSVSPGGGTTDDGGDATTGATDLEVDDPAALECILEALRDRVPFRYTTVDCDYDSTSTTYEVVSNGLVVTTIETAYGVYHDREQRISTFNEGYDFAGCVGAGVPNWEKRQCVEMSASGPCPVGPVACPPE